MEMRITGLRETIDRLSKLSADFQPTLEKITYRAILFVQGSIAPYPPPPPASTYTRTGTLGRSITSMAGQNPEALSRVESLFGGVRGIIGTNVKYAPYVIDEERQAEVHRGRWWTLQGEVRRLRDQIVKFYVDSLSEYLQKKL